jgi:hypothetical protein
MDWDLVFPDKSAEKEMLDLMKKVPAAIALLKRVTGKKKISSIHPMKEKRWGDKCWEAWELLVDIDTFLTWGLTPSEATEEFLKGWKPMDSAFVGKHETYSWRPAKGHDSWKSKVTIAKVETVNGN